jgi:hypothetical protein
MHFSIISKNILEAKFEFMLLKGFTLIQKFKFQKMYINVHNGLNISNTSFELFDLENVQYQPK